MQKCPKGLCFVSVILVQQCILCGCVRTITKSLCTSLSIHQISGTWERTLLASFSSSLKEPFKDLWKSITTWITLLYVVWPCFLKNCKNGSRHAFFFYQCTSCQIEIWIITHANPRGIHGRLHLCKVKWFCVLLRYNKTLTKRKRLPKSDKCLLTCQSHKYFWHLSKVYLKAVSQFLSALLEVLLQEKYGKNVYIYLDQSSFSENMYLIIRQIFIRHWSGLSLSCHFLKAIDRLAVFSVLKQNN